jgi:hypothetical protein
MQVLLGLHSLWRWVVLIVVVVALIRGIIAWARGGPWTRADRTLGLLTTSAIDIQVVLGLLLYGISQYWKGQSTFIAYIHPLVMIVALVIVHLANVRAKRLDSPIARHRTFTIGLIIALLLITAAIPPDAWTRAWAS